MSKGNVTIRTSDGDLLRSRLFVDDVDMSGITSSVRVEFSALELPSASINLSGRGEYEISAHSADIAIDGVNLPTSVQLALFEKLSEAFEMRDGRAAAKGEGGSGL